MSNSTSNDNSLELKIEIENLQRELRDNYRSKELLFKLINSIAETKNWNSLKFEKIQNLATKISTGYTYLIETGRDHKKCDGFYYITQWLFQYEEDKNKDITDESYKSIKIGRWNNWGPHKLSGFIEKINYKERAKCKIIKEIINKNKKDKFDVIFTNIKLGIEQEKLLTELEFEFYYIGIINLDKFGYITKYVSN